MAPGTRDGRSGWIRRYHPREDVGVRLVCLPHAGGGASAYFPLSRLAGPAIEVLSVQYPGRQDRWGEPAVEDIGTLAGLVAEHLADWNDRPLALFGHSMGSLVAYETARALEEGGGAKVLHLFVSGRAAPSRARRDMALDEWPDERVVSELRRFGGTDDQVLADDDVIRMSIPALRSDYRALRRYRCAEGSSVACGITALFGDSDVTVSADEGLGWRSHTRAGFQHLVLPGGHFYLNDQLRVVLRTITAQLTAGGGAG